MLSNLGDLPAPNCTYTTSTVLRLFTRAFSQAPLRARHLFRRSQTPMPLVLKNFRYPIVWQTIKGLAEEGRPELAPLIFHLFISFYDRDGLSPKRGQEQNVYKDSDDLLDGKVPAALEFLAASVREVPSGRPEVAPEDIRGILAKVLLSG